MERLFLLIIVLLFPCFLFADNWTVARTNIAEYPLGFILQETDIININEGDYLVIWNREKRQPAIIFFPGEKTVLQGIAEYNVWEQIRRQNLREGALRGEGMGEPNDLFLRSSPPPVWIRPEIN
jgi:hypothetical protein